MIYLYIDFKCPASYLAMRPTLALAQKLGVGINWRPVRHYQAPQLAKKPEESVSERHRRVRAHARVQTHAHYAAIQNLPMQFRDPPPSTDIALAALCVLNDTGADTTLFIEAAFQCYWSSDADLDSLHVVSALPGAPDMPDEQAARQRLETELASADAAGIFAAPTYIVHDQMFLGREHLPWITDLLTA
ncbi:MAG: DsbA family protein [PS1 clade bacterium]|nr:DsbA family protein [PS1 clade bacterium]